MKELKVWFFWLTMTTAESQKPQKRGVMIFPWPTYTVLKCTHNLLRGEDMSIFKNSKEEFQNAMSAAAFAEAGEFNTARQIAGKSKNSNKKVLVVLDSCDLNMRLLNYARNLCSRLGGQLEVLHKQRPRLEEEAHADIWEEFSQKDEIFAFTSLKADESLEDKLMHYGKTRRDILCVVMRNDLLEKGSAPKRKEKIWSPDWIMQKLNCPVMTYS
jgi:hypothetical protein